MIYKLGADNRLTIHQQITTRGAVDLTFYRTRIDSYLVVANGQDNVNDVRQDVQVYTWNTLTQLWTLIQTLPTHGAKHVSVFKDDARVG